MRNRKPPPVPTLRWEPSKSLMRLGSDALWPGWLGETCIAEDRWCGFASVIDLGSRQGKYGVEVRVGIQDEGEKPGGYAFRQRGQFEGTLVYPDSGEEAQQVVQGLLEQLFEAAYMSGLRVGPDRCPHCGREGGNCYVRTGSLCAF